jgi:hypothetical protein
MSAGKAGDGAAATTRSTPGVQRMVMFKHGVAYLERGGPCDGPFELSFKKDEMNDVLKSLAVWVARGEAKVGAVAFEKPEDPEEALVRRRLALEPAATLESLVTTLRGRRVAAHVAGKRHEGEVIGLQRESAEHHAERRLLVLRTADDAVTVVDLASLSSFDLLEAPSRADLAFFVDRSRAASAGENRLVHVDVRGVAEDLRVSYVIPAPTWRVSYRFARGDQGATIMAWAIVHNPADEDLEEVDLTLTTGQPVSFVIDLYNPKNVHRAVVEEQTRAAAAPTRFERAPKAMARGGAQPMPMRAMAMAPPGAMFDAMAEEVDDDTGEFARAAAGASFGGGGPGAMGEAASFEDRGELFEYRVASRVSLKRGGSAMVPLFSARIDASRERLWRDGSGPSPDLVLSFKNDTGAVLEEGAAVIYDGEVYAGEAMVPYSARNVEVKLAFAKDLGVRCKREATSKTVLDKVLLGAKAWAEEVRHELHHALTVESDHGEDVTVLVELPKNHGHELAPEGAQPFEDTFSYYRFDVKVPPRGRAVVSVIERWYERRRVGYESLDERRLTSWLSERFLDDATYAKLAEVLAAYAEARGHQAARSEAERRKQAAWAKQAKLTEQLTVLKDGGAEGDLRLRYVRELEVEQDRVNACEDEDTRLAQAASAALGRAAELALALST